MSIERLSDPAAETAAQQMLFAPLRSLGFARKGAEEYYTAISHSDDEIVRFGALCQTLAVCTLPAARIEEVLALCRHGAIKRRAYDYFQKELDTPTSQRIAAIPAQSEDVARTAQMQAELSFDFDGARDAAVALYRATGEIAHLIDAAHYAEHPAGWRAAAEWFVRAVAIFPLDPLPAAKLLLMLSEANQFDLVEELLRLLGRASLHPYLCGVFSGAVLLGRGDPKAALAALAALRPPPDPAPRVLKAARGHALRLAGEASERLGDFKGSYRYFVEMNRLELSPGVDGKGAIKGALSDSAITIPELPTLRRDDVVMMLGFARSGTTLLELVLGNHPDIEALEEPPTWSAAMAYVRSGRRSRAAAQTDPQSFFEAARNRYFDEVARHRQKPGAHFVVDKFPMRTLSAVPLKRMLPEQKYIFCIRHPFDVVLSCFRQRFVANSGMENFRTFQGSVEFYDFTMSQWFGVHTLADELVHYLKYDDLVTSFEGSVRGTLDFTGVEWDERVRDFAEYADSRVAVTPSYQKIRKGLSLGVQTYWRNYGFLFQTPEAKPLHKWAEFFAYPTA
ncbi:MAG: sulfotransferase [Devosia nanyangense]|uniref:Sulfotransferase n=1 Tax=Devosia nanyangense TaxID=1228055 RepID=A0A933NXD8_9HYPH|nr:sulfotransferase [Devosia nanyangense]